MSDKIPNEKAEAVQNIIQNTFISNAEKADMLLEYARDMIMRGAGSRDQSWRKKIQELPSAKELIKILEEEVDA